MNRRITAENSRKSFARFNSFFCVLLLLFVFCNLNKTQNHVSLYPNSRIKEQYHYFLNNDGDTIKTGRYHLWSENGRKIQEGRYFNGEKENIWKEWANNNQLILLEYWFKGKRYGMASKWDEQGRLIEKGNYVDDVKDGDWIERCVTASQTALTFQKNKYKNGKLIGQSDCR